VGGLPIGVVLVCAFSRLTARQCWTLGHAVIRLRRLRWASKADARTCLAQPHFCRSAHSVRQPLLPRTALRAHCRTYTVSSVTPATQNGTDVVARERLCSDAIARPRRPHRLTAPHRTCITQRIATRQAAANAPAGGRVPAIAQRHCAKINRTGAALWQAGGRVFNADALAARRWHIFAATRCGGIGKNLGGGPISASRPLCAKNSSNKAGIKRHRRGRGKTKGRSRQAYRRAPLPQCIAACLRRPAGACC